MVDIVVGPFKMINCHFWQDLMNVYFNVRMRQFHTQEDADKLIAEIKRIRPQLLSEKEFKKRVKKKRDEK